MKKYNAAVWLLDRHVSGGGAERTAFRADGRSVSYAELLREVWRVQNALRQLGIARGARVALMLDDELAFPAWFLGAIRSGAVPVPVPVTMTAAQMAAAMAAVAADAAVVSLGYADHLAAMAEGSDALRSVVVVGGPPALEATARRPTARDWAEFTDHGEAAAELTNSESGAFLLFTAGTTGAAKPVLHRHASPQAAAQSYAQAVLGASAQDRFFSVPKLCTAAGLGNSLLFPLAVGGCAVLDSHRLPPARVLEVIQSAHPTLFFASPRFLTAMLTAYPPRKALASVRITVSTGEPLAAGLYERFRHRFGHPVLDGLGSAEALHVFISNRPGAERPGTCGLPVPGWEVRIADPGGAEVGAGTPGQLHARGPALAVGYWREPGAGQPAIAGGWLATDDICRRGADGYVTFLGRSSDMIFSGGTWLAPAELESVLSEHPDVLEVAVVAERDNEDLQSPVALIVPRAGHRVDPDALAQYCRARLGPAAVPRRVILVRELRWTATGSMRRSDLRDLVSGHGAEVEDRPAEFPTVPRPAVLAPGNDPGDDAAGG